MKQVLEKEKSFKARVDEWLVDFEPDETDDTIELMRELSDYFGSLILLNELFAEKANDE